MAPARGASPSTAGYRAAHDFSRTAAGGRDRRHGGQPVGVLAPRGERVRRHAHHLLDRSRQGAGGFGGPRLLLRAAAGLGEVPDRRVRQAQGAARLREAGRRPDPDLGAADEGDQPGGPDRFARGQPRWSRRFGRRLRPGCRLHRGEAGARAVRHRGVRPARRPALAAGRLPAGCADGRVPRAGPDPGRQRRGAGVRGVRQAVRPGLPAAHRCPAQPPVDRRRSQGHGHPALGPR